MDSGYWFPASFLYFKTSDRNLILLLILIPFRILYMYFSIISSNVLLSLFYLTSQAFAYCDQFSANSGSVIRRCLRLLFFAYFNYVMRNLKSCCSLNLKNWIVFYLHNHPCASFSGGRWGYKAERKKKAKYMAFAVWHVWRSLAG